MTFIKKNIRLSELHNLKKQLRKKKLYTVCEEARCPNINECFKKNTATFMIMGNICTRNCKFCNVTNGRPFDLDDKEPYAITDAIKQMRLKYVVITSVTRDDLNDGGSNHFAQTIKTIKDNIPNIKIEVLTPDFKGDKDLIDNVINAKPDVFNHNIETVKELSKIIRPQASYQTSLNMLQYLAKKTKFVKSGFMLGLGENNQQISNTIKDLYNSGVNILTIGQYFQPSKTAFNVIKTYKNTDFEYWQNYAKQLGFKHIFSGVYVRSSYMAESLLGDLEAS